MKKIFIYLLLVLFVVPSVSLAQDNDKHMPTDTVIPSDNSQQSQQCIIQNLIANMVRVEGGTFTMGATSEQGNEAYDEEKPEHQVTVSSFSIGKYEVTQEEWQAVMDSLPPDMRDLNAEFFGAKHPVVCMSWTECQEFIRRLNKKTGRHFRLPTEAEWEFAARGGVKSNHYKYSGSNNLDEVAWLIDNSDGHTHAVGGKQANELGLYDMSGNVWEWCQDRFGNYRSRSQTNPAGPSSGSTRILRGGSWDADVEFCRVAYRAFYPTYMLGYHLGLRLAE